MTTISGMQQILRGIDLFRRSPRTTDWPSFDSLANAPETIDEMKAMTSTERRNLLIKYGVPQSAMPLFLRSMQSLTVLHLPENVNRPPNERPILHPYRSAAEWNPLVPHGSILAPSIVLAPPPASMFAQSIEDFAESTTATAAVAGGLESQSGISSAQREGGLSPAATASGAVVAGPPPYPGLLNQGSTCYLNSILQSLFHLGSFRSAIMSIPTEDVIEPTTSIPLALQRLFYAMALQSAPQQHNEAVSRVASFSGKEFPSTNKTVTNTATTMIGQAQTTNELTKSFGWTEQDAFIQHDAHELVRKLIDNMEEAVAKKIRDGSMSAHPSGSPVTAKPAGNTFASASNASSSSTSDTQQPQHQQHNQIRELFTGTLENYVDVKDVNYRSATSQVFYELQLVVKNHQHVYSSLDALLEPNVLEGKNKYCLERNGQKSYHDAKTGCVFLNFPPVLMLHLARFDYDPYKDEMVKVSTRYEYYDELDLSRYTPKLPANQCQYQLHAVLVHNGRTANFGHYFCYVRCPVSSSSSSNGSERWIKFNDEQVSYAPRSEVFGANFGGFTLNHWGSEVPQTKSAYMLIYVRKPAAELLKGPSTDEIPAHLKERYRREQEAKELQEREQREAHLYTKVYFVTQADLEDHHAFLRYQHPPSLKFPQRRTLRIENTAKALGAFQQYATNVLLLDGPLCTFWYVEEEVGFSRLSKHLSADALVGSIAHGREMCVLVMPPRGASLLNRAGRNAISALDDSLPEPTALEDFMAELEKKERGGEGSGEDAKGEADEKGEAQDKKQEDSSSASESLPASPLLGAPLPPAHLLKHPIITHHYFYNPNNLKEGYLQSLVVPDPKHIADEDPIALKVFEEASRSSTTASTTTAAGLPQTVSDLLQFLERHGELMPCVVFQHTSDYGVVDVSSRTPASGAHYYWQLESQSPFLHLYPTYDHFQEFLKTRTPVELKSVTPPYNTVCTARLSLKMPYEYVQRYFAITLNEPNFDKIRFSRHNPETNGPFFMKIKKNKGSTLETLMTASKKLSKVLYYEILDKYTVTEIESANPLSFDHFSDSCQYVATYMILMPPPTDFTHATLLRSCLSEAGLNMDNAPRYHLLDVWKGRIYGCYAFDNDAKLGRPFEESAEYRLEKAPKPIDGVAKNRQLKVPVSHFHVASSNNKVTTHGDPFYLYLSLDDTLDDLRVRIQQCLGVSEQAIQDWKIRLVHCERIVSVSGTMLIGEQIETFLKGKTFDVVESDPLTTPFLGLEHAPAVQRRGGPARTTGNDLRIGA